jgi:hypothetical protein
VPCKQKKNLTQRHSDTESFAQDGRRGEQEAKKKEARRGKGEKRKAACQILRGKDE